MDVAGRVGEHVLLKLSIDLTRFLRGAGQGFLESRTDVARHRLPRGTLPHVLEVGEHVVDHPMTQRAELFPILGI